MHRDISAGNMLEFDRNPTSAAALQRTSHDIAQVSMDNSSARKCIDGLASGDAHDEVLMEKAKSLQRVLNDLEIPTTCRTVRTDWDTAANLNVYSEHSSVGMALVSTKYHYADFSNGASTGYQRVSVMGNARGQGIR